MTARIEASHNPAMDDLRRNKVKEDVKAKLSSFRRSLGEPDDCLFHPENCIVVS